jgi:phosphoribosyl 1,2-cyclic phosphodiesterase
MRYAALASGSKGNCHAFSDGQQILLIDAGISYLQIRTRLERIGWEPSQVQAVAITHEHSDHIAAIPVLLRRTMWNILATPETLAAIERIHDLEVPRSRWLPLRPGKTIDWESWRILPFATPHDAVDSVAYRLEVSGFAAAVVTDLGHPTALVVDHCQDLDLLALEANHDITMLREGDYPPLLKARILSRVGHLSNEASAELLQRCLSPRLQSLVLAHLSEQNNHPDLARFSAQEVLGSRNTQLHVAQQREPLLISDLVPRSGLLSIDP